MSKALVSLNRQSSQLQSPSATRAVSSAAVAVITLGRVADSESAGEGGRLAAAEGEGGGKVRGRGNVGVFRPEDQNSAELTRRA
jgi:hypothetical protein